MKKMLYLMSIDWRWIIQRPQLLAKELQKEYDVTVVCTRPIIKRWKNQKEFAGPKNLRTVHYFPMQEKVSLFKKLHNYELKKALRDINSFDYVFMGGTEWWPYLYNYKGKLIYDCMDDYYAMQQSEAEKTQIFLNESEIVKRADIVLTSSNKLKETLIERYQVNNIQIVRNGLRGVSLYPIQSACIKEKYILGYVGTVASWMDFVSLKSCTNKLDNIDIHMIGPAPGYEDDEKARIYFDGVREHGELYASIKEFDCLMMPFILNDIVLAVDPVKLYEYISFGKCIVCIFYPEVERFKDYVYFYNDSQEFVDLIQKLSENGFPTKYSSKQQEEFLKCNTWEIRGNQIQQYISMEEKK